MDAQTGDRAAQDRTPIMAKRAFLFPGQGAQSVGMAVGLCEALPAAKALFDQAADVLGYDLLAVCRDGPKERLDSTAVSQPAIYVASLAALEQQKVQEPEAAGECVAAAGLSLGEYTALTFAGALSFADGLRLVQKRGEAMQMASDLRASGMVSVIGADQAKVQELVDQASTQGLLRLANFLCPGNLAVSGDRAACDELMRLAEVAGARAVRLAVAGAFHTPIMQPAVEQLAEALAGVAFTPLRVPVWANVTAQPYADVSDIPPLLSRQVVEPVRWEETMRGLLAAGVEVFHEIGPGRVLAGLLKRVHRKADCRNITA
ncbi:MAG: ACP S-malonyltransferase [Gemmataceae bacterium]